MSPAPLRLLDSVRHDHYCVKLFGLLYHVFDLRRRPVSKSISEVSCKVYNCHGEGPVHALLRVSAGMRAES